MAKADTVAVLLPGAFYFLRETQLPPMDALRKHKVKIAIASDLNPGTSPALSLRLMLNMACTCFRMTPEEALAGATIHAAKRWAWPTPRFAGSRQGRGFCRLADRSPGGPGLLAGRRSGQTRRASRRRIKSVGERLWIRF
jgi:hypothetical protein